MVLLTFTPDGSFICEVPKSHAATTTGKLTEETLVYHADFRRRGDTWAIVICGFPDDPENHVHVKVSASRGELEAGTEYRFFGRWTENGFGRTFDAKSWAPALPCGKTGIIRCLEKCPGIGVVTAARMWEAFGAEAVHMLIDQPEFGNRGPTLIRRNPFLLSQFSGAGFRRCDDLWLSIGLNPARLKRQTLCLAHAISRESSGATWFAPEWCERLLNQTLSGADPQPAGPTGRGR